MSAGSWLIGAIGTTLLLGAAQGTPQAPATVTVGRGTEQGQRYTEDYYKFTKTCYEDDILLTTLAPEAAVSEAACLATCTATAYCAAVAVPVGEQAGTRCRLLSQAATALLSDCLVDPSNVEVFLKPQKPAACTYAAQTGKECVETASRQLLGTFTKVAAPGNVADRDKCRVNNDDTNQGDFDKVEGISELDCKSRAEDGPTPYVGYEFQDGDETNASVCELHKTIITNAVAGNQGDRRQVCFQYAKPPDTIQKAERCQQVSNLNPECGITVEFETGTSKCYCTASPLNGGLSGICTIQDNLDFTLYTHSCLKIAAVTTPPVTGTETPTEPSTDTDAPTDPDEDDGKSETLIVVGVSSGIVAATTLFTVALFIRSRNSGRDFPDAVPVFSIRGMDQSKKDLMSDSSSDLSPSPVFSPRNSGSSFGLAGPPPIGILKAEKKRQKKKKGTKAASEISGPTAVYYPKFAFGKIVNSLRSSNGVTLRESEVVSVQSPSSRFNFFSRRPKVPPSLPPRPASPGASALTIDTSSDISASTAASPHREHRGKHHKKRHHGRAKNEQHRAKGKNKPTESQKLYTMV